MEMHSPFYKKLIQQLTKLHKTGKPAFVYDLVRENNETVKMLKGDNNIGVGGIKKTDLRFMLVISVNIFGCTHDKEGFANLQT